MVTVSAPRPKKAQYITYVASLELIASSAVHRSFNRTHGPDVFHANDNATDNPNHDYQREVTQTPADLHREDTSKLVEERRRELVAFYTRRLQQILYARVTLPNSRFFIPPSRHRRLPNLPTLHLPPSTRTLQVGPYTLTNHGANAKPRAVLVRCPLSQAQVIFCFPSPRPDNPRPQGLMLLGHHVEELKHNPDQIAPGAVVCSYRVAALTGPRAVNRIAPGTATTCNT
ncbi:hypothetical protein K435DRAFT_774543 [Dendrothele bispora CBS 962.96]|uniref:Uncharacterized protein n=1 Tax=Dendrothele bispora (strain CBS 962.96) TaxID=1314807 RepID=A0A4S8MMP3_DENBC|nr:hypothetical protein K435DRAFT_774543 [Dendrothele bispora CBS 962.96]